MFKRWCEWDIGLYAEIEERVSLYPVPVPPGVQYGGEGYREDPRDEVDWKLSEVGNYKLQNCRRHLPT